MRTLPLVVACVALLGGCGTEPEPEQVDTAVAPSTAAMVERLRRIATEVEPFAHPYIRSARLDSALRIETPANPAQRLQLEALIGLEALRVGHIEDAIGRFERVLAGATNDPGQVPPELVMTVVEWLGTALVRLWERDHCVRGTSVRPCLFPIAGGDRAASSGAISDDARRASANAARAAANLHATLLDATTPLDSWPGNRSARWLLNLSHMMAGDYPGGVPARHLIAPEAFRSEYEIGRFDEIAHELGVDVLGHAGGAVMDDFDGDGNLDIVASSWHLSDQLRLFLNRGDGTFEDVTRAAGLEGLTGGLNLAQADYDNDGHLDLLVLRGAWTEYGEPNSLLRNNGDGTFEDVTEAAGLLSSHPTQTASWGDYDNDGHLDLYIGNENAAGRGMNAAAGEAGGQAAALRPNQLFHNNGDGTFTDRAAEAGVDVTGFVKAVQWGDIDGDGRLDLYVSRLGEPNLLFRNEGPDSAGRWRFTDVTARAGVAEPMASFPIWFWDFDDDGRLDLLVSGYQGTPDDLAAEYLGLPHDGERPRLYRNQGDGTFAEVGREVGLDRVLLTMGSNFGDLDNDGYEDFYAGTGEAHLQTIVPNRMFRNAGGERFQEVTASGGFGHLGKGHGVAFGDIDHDGDQDIYVTMGGAYDGDVARNVLFRNPGHGNRWITLRLEGVRSNRSAIGARVRVTVSTEDGGTRTLHRTVSSGGSFGANSLQQEIGLGRATAVEAVEVTWPATGATDRFTGVELDRIYRVREGDERLTPLDPPRIPLGPGPTGGDEAGAGG
ncbi:MAG TPA: CRTAC1 family protein [Longimicrobiales bacterium]|nr:CRTAC1 family protein [Longimicrobiales bacterium]